MSTEKNVEKQRVSNESNVELYSSNDVAGATNIEYRELIVLNLVKSRNMFSNMGAGFKSMVGGNIKGLTKLTSNTRNELINMAIHQAQTVGANAIIGIRFETSEIFEGMIDIIIYGTAVYYTR